jgi:AcrR family transcriptional regulator
MSSEKNPTRTRILNAAWRLLEEGGTAARMADIARAAGISRQALYLHFPTRAELLIATTRHIDEVHGVDARLAASRTATGVARLDAFILAWGGYIPRIHGISRALRAMQATDAEARIAWDDRMLAVRAGCEAAVRAVAEDGKLRPTLDAETATDLLWALLSVETWERLVIARAWSQARYIDEITAAARHTLLAPR